MHLFGAILNCGKSSLQLHSFCMVKKISQSDGIERVVIKIPKQVADYLRLAWPHGKRSEFIARCILEYKHQQEVKDMEEKLRQAGTNRQ